MALQPGSYLIVVDHEGIAGCVDECEGNFGLSVVTTTMSEAEAAPNAHRPVFFLGLPKTGSTSLHRLTRARAPVHEFLMHEQMHAVTQRVTGAWSRELFAQFHENRQRQLFGADGRRAGIDCSTLNHRFADVILAGAPGAKIILTVREPYAWAGSFLRQLVHSAEPCFLFDEAFKANCFTWISHPQPFPIDSFESEDTVRRDAPKLARMLIAYYIKQHTHLREQLAARDGGLDKNNLLVLRTEGISDTANLARLARFVWLAPGELAMEDGSHANRGVLSEEDNLLADIDREWFDGLFARTAPAFLATLLGLLTIDDEAAQNFYLQAAATVEEEECIEKS